MSSISPFLWFDDQAEEAVAFYVSLFPNSSVGAISRYPEGSESPGSVISIQFLLDGVEMQALNGGPLYQFTEAISLSVNVRTQDEVDRLWDQLTRDGGDPGRCGWLKDRYGLSWQVVPSSLGELLGDPDPERQARVTAAMLQMDKLDIGVLEAARDGR